MTPATASNSGRSVATGTRSALWFRLRPVLYLSLGAWVVFGAFRAILLLLSYSQIKGVSLGEIGKCMLIGLRYDAVPIGYAMLPLVAVMFLLPDRRLTDPTAQKRIAVYATALAMAVVMVEVLGVGYFLHFYSRLDWMVISYSIQDPREVAGHVLGNYPILLVPPSVWIIFKVLYPLFRRVLWSRPAGGGNAWLRVGVGLLLAAACVAACRGGWDRRPLRFGPAIFSENNIVNQLAMNNFFKFSKAVQTTINDDDPPRLHPLPPLRDSADEAMAMLLQKGETPLGSKINPFWRRTETGRPLEKRNVVLIVMEGMAGSPVGAQGFSPSYTPCLDELCRDGLFFDRMYAVGERTSRGIVGVLCGHPDAEGDTIMVREKDSHAAFLTLPEIFRGRGYHTIFFYGGNTNFDNMGPFLLRRGLQEVVSEKEILAEGPPSPDLEGNWGLHDEVIFRQVAQRLHRLPQPFFALVLTVSNHSSYEIPYGRVPALVGGDMTTRKLNAFRYADWAIGQFFEKARQSEYFQNTIFVLVADHGHDLVAKRIMDVPGHRIPGLFYAPGIIAPRRVSTVASQMDIAPTLLAMLGGSYEHCFLGRNILAVRPEDGFAMMHSNDNITFVTSDHAVVEPPDSPPMIFDIDAFNMVNITALAEHDKTKLQMQKKMLAYYGAAMALYEKHAYCRPHDITPQRHEDPKVTEEPKQPATGVTQ